MHHSKLVQLLKSLTPEEAKEFPKFLNSPFFNSNKQCLVLYRLLLTFYPAFDSAKMTKEKVYIKLFPGRPYNYHILSNLMSKLAALTEEYLLNLQFQKEEFAKKNMLLKAYSDRVNGYEFYQKNNQKIIQEKEGRIIEDFDFHQELWSLHHDYYFHPTTNRQTTGSVSLKKAMNHLDLFYAQTKLLYQLELNSRAYLFDEQFPALLSGEELMGKENLWSEHSPLCLIYSHLLKLYKGGKNEPDFINVKNLFLEKLELIGPVEKNIVLLHLLNYCIRLINKGEEKYFGESLNLYKIGLTFEAFIEHNRMAEVTFSNIVSVGARCGEFGWTENFIADFKKYLDEEEREGATILSLALLYFTQGKYGQVSALLLNHLFDKPLHIIKSKNLLIRSYFEQFLIDDSYFELLIAQTYSFEKHIRRNKGLSSDKINGYLNFIKFTRRIANGIIDRNISVELIESIKSNTNLMYKSWLQEKAESAIKR